MALLIVATNLLMFKLYVHPDTIITLSLSSALKYARYQWLIDQDGIIYRDTPEGRTTLVFCLKLDAKIDPLAEVALRDNNPLNLTLENLVEIPYKLSKGYSSYRGVSWDNKRGKWIAQLTHQGSRVLYKRCVTEMDALSALNTKRKELGMTIIQPVS